MNNVEPEYMQPGTPPPQNAFVERFNGISRASVIGVWCLLRLDHAREEIDRWLEDYNTILPHESLGDVSLVEFLTPRGNGHAELSSKARN